MKIRNIVGFLSLLLLLNSCMYRNHSVSKYDEQLKQEVVVGTSLKLNLPMFLIKPIIYNQLKDEIYQEEIKNFLKKVRNIKVKVLTGELNKKDSYKRIRSSKKQNGLDWFSLKSKDQDIHIISIEKKGKIKRMQIVIQTEESTVVVDLKGKFKKEDIINLASLTLN